MTQFAHPGGSDVTPFVLTTGAAVPASGLAWTLTSGTTYVFPLGGECENATIESIHLKWDATWAGTITFEACNFMEILVYDSVAGNWIQENPTTVYVSNVGTGGLTATALTLTVATGVSSGTTIHLGNQGARRVRIKAATTTTGALRCAVHGKS